MINLNKKYKYLIRIWEFPSLNKIEDQFVFQSDFNAELDDEVDGFWSELFDEHSNCFDKCTDWQFLYYLEIGELVS